MGRLTRKVIYEGEILYGSPNGIKCDDLEHLDKVYKKLGELEDKENELGCPLNIYLTAIKDKHIYIKTIDDKITYSTIVEITYKHFAVKFYSSEILDYQVLILKISDYKKTWSTIKEDLNIN